MHLSTSCDFQLRATRCLNGYLNDLYDEIKQVKIVN